MAVIAEKIIPMYTKKMPRALLSELRPGSQLTFISPSPETMGMPRRSRLKPVIKNAVAALPTKTTSMGRLRNLRTTSAPRVR